MLVWPEEGEECEEGLDVDDTELDEPEAGD
jgi:hypothetical protein